MLYDVIAFIVRHTGPTSNPTAPTTPIENVKGAINLEVVNEHGVDMFANTHDNTPGTGPNGASDGTLPAGANKTLTVRTAALHPVGIYLTCVRSNPPSVFLSGVGGKLPHLC